MTAPFTALDIEMASKAEELQAKRHKANSWKFGDFYKTWTPSILVVTQELNMISGTTPDNTVWLPRLDQLFAILCEALDISPCTAISLIEHMYGNHEMTMYQIVLYALMMEVHNKRWDADARQWVSGWGG